jgi:hypothetical protein
MKETQNVHYEMRIDESMEYLTKKGVIEWGKKRVDKYG